VDSSLIIYEDGGCLGDEAYDGTPLWHHDSRGAQMFYPLYGYNAPTWLLTQSLYVVCRNNKKT
jgi:hypothetical protein